MKNHILTILLAAAAVAMPGLSAASPGAEKEKIAKLQQELLGLKFGMFLHYNMATYTNEQWVVGYPEFKGNVAAVYTHDMAIWRKVAVATATTAATRRFTWTSAKPWAKPWSSC